MFLYKARKVGKAHKQSQGSSALGVDEEQGRDRGYDLDGTVAKRCVQCLGRCVADIFEDS